MVQRVMAMMAAALTAAFFLSVGSAHAQSVLQAGPVTGAHAPMYAPGGGSAAVLMDSGPAGGGGPGVGLGELNITAKGAPGSGTGPFGTHSCVQDAATSSGSGYHYLCVDANTGGHTTIVSGAAGGASPIPCEFIVNGVIGPCLNAAINGLPEVPNNATLRETASTYAAAIVREDFSSGNGAPPQVYLSNSTAPGVPGAACSNPDNGAQVPAADGGCWDIAPSATGYSPMEWGALGNATTDDTAALQAATNYIEGIHSRMLLGPHLYAVNAPGITCNNNMQIIGSAANETDGTSYQGTSGFVPIVVNETLLTLAPPSSGIIGCGGSYFGHFYIGMGAAGANTAGAAILVSAGLNNDVFDKIAINAPCIGMDLNGFGQLVEDLKVTQVAGSTCGGVRVGHYTILSSTVDPRIINPTIQGSQTNPAAYGIKFEDMGGGYLEGSDILYEQIGTWIDPGFKQIVSNSVFTNWVFGDTTIDSPLVIDSADPTAQAFNIRATQSWGAAFTSTSGLPGILIQNSSGVPVAHFSGFHFKGQDVFSVSGNGVTINGLMKGFTASIAGTNNTQMTVTAASATPLAVGDIVQCDGCAANTTIFAFVSGTGGTGTYTVSQQSAPIASEGMTVNDSPLNVSFAANSELCGMGDKYGGSPPSGFYGLEIGANVSVVTYKSSKISGQCDGTNGGHPDYAVKMDGSNTDIMLQDDNFQGWSIGAVSGEPVQAAPTSATTGASIITNNIGVDDQPQNITAAATIDPGVYPNIVLTGATAITTIDGCWYGRQLTIRPGSNLTFSTGGNIAAAFSATTAIPVTAVASTTGGGACNWYLH